MKRYSRSGWKIAGVKDNEYIGLHLVRAAQIAYILAQLEGVDPEKTACIVFFHDNGELRVGDQYKLVSRYFNIKKAEKKAFFDQLRCLPKDSQVRLGQYYSEFELHNTKEGVVAKDADWLETAITAKEYLEQGGSKLLQKWINNVKKVLESKSVKKILNFIEIEDDFTNFWWQGLKKMTYDKLYK